MKDVRRAKLAELLEGPPFNGSRSAFCVAAGITKGRLSQLLDTREAFGEAAARNLERSIGLPNLFLDAPNLQLNHPEKLPVQVDPPAKQAGEASATAMEIALLYDLIPASDRVRRTRAYNAATKAILDVLEERPATE